MSKERSRRLAILTSGGDAPGMNAVVRAAVRTALERGAEMYAVTEGFQGLVDGGDRIRKMSWNSVGGVLQKGGTAIGTARSKAFRTREGRISAAKNMLMERIDGLIVVGGDGSLTGADIFRREWPSLVADLVKAGAVQQEIAQRYPRLSLAGLVGSIDNDFAGTDMTIGADTALHRIVEAIDALSSTAASHQRTFVVEVMGRDCGYLALMSGLATGSSWVLIPEAPPDVDDWEERMCQVIKEGHAAGRRHSTVIIAEGARDRDGKPIEAERVRSFLQEKLDLEVRTTVLGHVQRGGSPSAFDRIMGTLLGSAAVDELLNADPDTPPCVLGIHENRVTRTPLMECVEKTRSVGLAITDRDYERAMDIRGQSFRNSFRIHRTLVRALPHPPQPGQKRLRFAVMHAGAPAPGMNTAVRTAVRLGVDKGHLMLGIRNGFEGLLGEDIQPMDWMSVHGFVSAGGAELGTNRKVPNQAEVETIGKILAKHEIQGLLIIGGWTGYEAAHRLLQGRPRHEGLRIPIVCVPAAIDNNLPSTEFSLGADTALNSIVDAVDKIKQSAVAWKRCVVVEVMGRYCGYLAALSGLASGAERVYTHEEGITMGSLEADLKHLIAGFSEGKRLGLIIRNENANPVFSTSVLRSLFEAEGKDLFDARQAILGHLQQGGNPTPFDRIQATRMAARCIDFLVGENANEEPAASYIGQRSGRLQFFDLADFPDEVDMALHRPRNQWWLSVLPILRLLAQPGPSRTEIV